MSSELLAFTQYVDHAYHGATEFLWSFIFGLLSLAIRETCGSCGQLLEKGFYRGTAGDLVAELFPLFHNHSLPRIYRHFRVGRYLGVGEGQRWGAMRWLSAVCHTTWHPCGGDQEWGRYSSLI